MMIFAKSTFYHHINPKEELYVAGIKFYWRIEMRGNDTNTTERVTHFEAISSYDANFL